MSLPYAAECSTGVSRGRAPPSDYVFCRQPFFPPVIIGIISYEERRRRRNIHQLLPHNNGFSAESFGPFSWEDRNLQCLNGAQNSWA